MKDFFVNSGFLTNRSNDSVSSPPAEKRRKRDSHHEGKSLGTTSDTTIYRNAFEKIDKTTHIMFKVNKANSRGRESTSSEEQVNTSDELMEVDVVENQNSEVIEMDINERFIAD